MNQYRSTIHRQAGISRTLRARAMVRTAMFFCLMFFLRAAAPVDTIMVLSADMLGKAEKRYGAAAKTRLLRWRDLIAGLRNQAEIDKLNGVNQFINQLPFVSDPAHWNQQDYWATPAEMIASDGGDCEDFAIAKYFTLLAAGVPADKLRITYVFARIAGTAGMAHMVLAYYPVPNAEPLVLDNLRQEVLKASARPDLTAVYHFNGTGLWLAKARGSGEEVRHGQDNIAIWRDLNLRMSKELR